MLLCWVPTPPLQLIVCAQPQYVVLLIVLSAKVLGGLQNVYVFRVKASCMCLKKKYARYNNSNYTKVYVPKP